MALSVCVWNWFLPGAFCSSQVCSRNSRGAGCQQRRLCHLLGLHAGCEETALWTSFSQVGASRRATWDWCFVWGMWMLFVPGFKTNPSRGGISLPQTGRGARQNFEEKASAMIVLVGSWNRVRGWEGRIQGHERPAFLDDSAMWIFRSSELERKMARLMVKSYWGRVTARSMVDDRICERSNAQNRLEIMLILRTH